MSNPSVMQEIPLIQKAYLQYMKREFISAADRSKATLLQNKNYATKQLIQSLSGGSDLQNSQIIGSFGANTPYAEDMETGETKINPTVSEIYAWVVRKVHLGHIKLNEWAKNKTLAPFNTRTANKIRKQSIETTMMNIAKRTALNISITGKLKSAKPYLKPSYDQLIRNLDQNFPLEIE